MLYLSYFLEKVENLDILEAWSMVYFQKIIVRNINIKEKYLNDYCTSPL